jgi:hypothetical protein
MMLQFDKAEYNKEWKRKNREKYLGYARKSANSYYRANKQVLLEKRAEKKRTDSISIMSREMLRGARKRAKKKSIVCTIELSDIKIPAACPLLGIPLFMGEGRQCDNSPTLDRIDNALGYIPGNVWVISQKTNRCKNSLSADEIILIGMRLKKVQTKNPHHEE